MVSTQDLLDHVGLVQEDLNTKCDDEDLRELSLVISNWERYAPFLKLTEADIEDIETKNTRGNKMLLALQRWKQMFAFKATFGFLVNDVFMKTMDAENAQRVCLQLKRMLHLMQVLSIVNFCLEKAVSKESIFYHTTILS